MARPEPRTITLILRPMPDPLGWRTPTYRLKQVLKVLLRSFGFRCIRIDYPEDDLDNQSHYCENTKHDKSQ